MKIRVDCNCSSITGRLQMSDLVIDSIESVKVFSDSGEELVDLTDDCTKVFVEAIKKEG